jgi:hypothetical protein
MRTVSIVLGALLCSTIAQATPVVVDREAVQAQLQGLANQVSALRNQLAGMPGSADPETLRRLGMVVGQLNQLQREVVSAPMAGGWRTPPPPPPPRPERQPIDDGTLQSLVAQINGEAFSQGKLTVLQQAAGTNWFLVAQVRTLLPLFSFDEDKLKALETLSRRLLDRNNAFQIYELFSFSSSKEKAREILSH